MFTSNITVFHVYNFLPGKIDPASRKLMKNVCGKWKGKSIYQVLLMDRANKLQDVVYFSLQVSLVV